MFELFENKAETICLENNITVDEKQMRFQIYLLLTQPTDNLTIYVLMCRKVRYAYTEIYKGYWWSMYKACIELVVYQLLSTLRIATKMANVRQSRKLKFIESV